MDRDMVNGRTGAQTEGPRSAVRLQPELTSACPDPHHSIKANDLLDVPTQVTQEPFLVVLHLHPQAQSHITYYLQSTNNPCTLSTLQACRIIMTLR